MVRQPPMRMSMPALIWGLAWLGAFVGLAGAWPTWCLRGGDGLVAQCLAGAVAAAVALASGLTLRRIARAGPAMATLGFLAGIPVRMAACCVAGLLLVTKYAICVETFFIWLGLFYLATMLKESAWLSAALSRDAQLVSLGELRRPCRQLWDRHRIR